MYSCSYPVSGIPVQPHRSISVRKKLQRRHGANPVLSFCLDGFIERLGLAIGYSDGSACRPSDPSLCQSSLVPLRRDPVRFAWDYLKSEVYSKYDDETSSALKDQRAFEKFHAAEEQCLRTNMRLRNGTSWGTTDPKSEPSLLQAAARKIYCVLGPFCWNEAYEGFGFGPGATTRLNRLKADAASKFSGTPETTNANLALASAVLLSSPLWREATDSSLRVVGGNKVVTVPKSYKINRVIAIEPDMNIFVQKGIGSMIRRRLLRVRINLNDQTINQSLARFGSALGSLATVDLSSASDTISYELVKLLLPPDWFDALEQCRSPIGTLPSGEVVNYQKFSSMGNGYTFELESLIFWAIVSAVCEAYHTPEDLISVYGDDIIIPSHLGPHLENVLHYSGFTLNRKKSFWDGYFRESCGYHGFSGYEVTPFYVRRRVRYLSDLFLLHNNVRRWMIRVLGYAVEPFLAWLRSHAPNNWRKPRIPDGIGDGAFVGTLDQCTPVRTKSDIRRGFGHYSIRVLVQRAVVGETEVLGRLVGVLHRLESRRGYPGVHPSKQAPHLVEVAEPLSSLKKLRDSWVTCLTPVWEWRD